MESKYQHTTSGQAVYEGDMNLLGEEAALADDRVFAELVRMLPFATAASRGVMPFRTDGMMSGSDPALPGQCIVQPAIGKVVVKPFRAFIGSRAVVGAGVEKANWRDIRSAIMVGSSALDSDVTFAATDGATQRVDLVYAAVTVDANDAGVTRKVKDGTTGLVTSNTVIVTKSTTIALGVVQGADNDPTLPTIPADAAGTYYIPLAYVHVPVSFGGATLLASNNIYECSPQITFAGSTGAAVIRPANGQWDPAGAVNTNFPFALSNRKGGHLPPTMTGGDEVLVALDLLTAIAPHYSHVSGDIVDDSRDWTKRVWTWQMCAVGGGSSPTFPWVKSSIAPFVPAETAIVGAGGAASGFGQSMVQDYSASKAGVLHVTPTQLTGMAATSTIDLYVDLTTGALKIDYTNAPNIKGFIWLRASGQFGNAR